uniref:Uncharacterized protein n=1 Tax=Sphaerodactylus townsendi TaxID=933632 RepID=A0ACB8FZZ2_9SAUR
MYFKCTIGHTMGLAKDSHKVAHSLKLALLFFLQTLPYYEAFETKTKIQFHLWTAQDLNTTNIEIQAAADEGCPLNISMLLKSTRQRQHVVVPIKVGDTKVLRHKGLKVHTPLLLLLLYIFFCKAGLNSYSLLPTRKSVQTFCSKKSH